MAAGIVGFLAVGRGISRVTSCVISLEGVVRLAAAAICVVSLDDEKEWTEVNNYIAGLRNKAHLANSIVYLIVENNHSQIRAKGILKRIKDKRTRLTHHQYFVLSNSLVNRFI